MPCAGEGVPGPTRHTQRAGWWCTAPSLLWAAVVLQKDFVSIGWLCRPEEGNGSGHVDCRPGWIRLFPRVSGEGPVMFIVGLAGFVFSGVSGELCVRACCDNAEVSQPLSRLHEDRREEGAGGSRPRRSIRELCGNFDKRRWVKHWAGHLAICDVT